MLKEENRIMMTINNQIDNINKISKWKFGNSGFESI
jgi:hypothetical protein